jgi:hypothetical protein
MFCQNCGTQLPDGSKFCDNCGTRLDNVSAYDSNYTQQPGAGYGNNNTQQPGAGYGNNYAQQPGAGYGNNYAQQPYQSYPHNNSQNYSGYNTASTVSQAGNGEIPLGRYAWIIGAGTLIMIVITVILAVITRGDDEAVESLSYVITFAKIALLWMDSREIKKCGYKISPLWYILGVFCAGPYLFVRAKQIDNNFKYFYLWVFSAIVLIVMLVVLMPLMR